jgi:hypothetical protein
MEAASSDKCTSLEEQYCNNNLHRKKGFIVEDRGFFNFKLLTEIVKNNWIRLKKCTLKESRRFNNKTFI